VGEEFGLVFRDTVDGDFVKILSSASETKWQANGYDRRRDRGTYTLDTGVDEGNLFLDWKRGILSLFQEFLETFTSVEGLFSSCIQIGTELCEGCDFTVLSQEEFQGTSDLFHCLGLVKSFL
jgi:hypothetical protein